MSAFKTCTLGDCAQPFSAAYDLPTIGPAARR